MEAVKPKPFTFPTPKIKQVQKPILKKDKPKVKKSVKNKVGFKLPDVLPGNGQHKAVGLIKGILSIDGFKELKNGKQRPTYKLKIDKLDTEVKATLNLGVRVLGERKPDLLLDKPHTFIVYPKFNRDGFYVEIIAFDDEYKSPIANVCADCEFIFMGVWNQGRLLVQQSVDKLKKGEKAKIFKYKFERINLKDWCEKLPIFKDMNVLQINARLEYDDESFKLFILKVFECF